MKKFILLTALVCGFLVSNSQSYTYIAQRYRWLAGLFEALGMPAGDSAQFKPGQRQQAGAVYYDSTGGDAGFYMWNGTAWVLQGSPTAIDLRDEILNDPSVTYSGSGLKFYVSPVIYRINGLIYATDYDSVTLATADPTDPRKDVLYVDIEGLKVLTGVPAGPAAEPLLSGGELKLTVIDLQAGASVPTITTNIIYDENLGESVVTAGGPSPPTIDADNTTNVYHLTKSINATNLQHLGTVFFTLPSTVDLTTYEGFSIFLRLKAVMHATANIYVTFFNGSTAISNEVKISVNRNSLTYQGNTVPLSLFTLQSLFGPFADGVRLRWYQYTPVVHPGFYLDYVHWESGVEQPGGGGSPVTIGPINSVLPSPNGLNAANNVIVAQTASQTYPGLLSAADKTKLDSLKSDYYIINKGNGVYIAVTENDSTVGVKTFVLVGGTLIDTDTTFGVDLSSVGGSQTLQQIFNQEVGGSLITKNDTILLNGFNLIIKGAGTTEYTFQPEQFNFLNSNGSGATQVTGVAGGGIDAIANFTGSNNSSILNLSDGFARLNAQNSLGPESNIYVYPDSIALAPQNGALKFRGILPGVGTTALRYDPSTNAVTYGDTASGGGGGISLTTTGTSGPATLVGTVLNVPDYSGGAAIWSGTVLGTTFSATSATINNGAVQWTFTGSSPATFTLPARTSSVNQFYTIKNIGSADLTVAAAGSDDIFTTTSVTSVTVDPGGSIMLTGGANGTSDLWTALFHTIGSSPNILLDSTDTDGPATLFAAGDTLRARTITGTGGINVNLSATGGYEIDGSGIGGAGGTVTRSWFDDTLTIGSEQIVTDKADIFDDFVTAVVNTGGSSFTHEFATGTGANAIIDNTLGPTGTGWIRLTPGTTSTGVAAIGTTSVSVVTTKVDTTYDYRFEKKIMIETLSNDTDDFRIVLGNVVYTTNTTGNNQIWFRYNDNTNSGNWTCYSSDGSTTESTNSGVAVAAGTIYTLAYRYNDASITFYINGTLVATHTTRMPAHGTGFMMPVTAMTKTLGTTALNAYEDYLKWRR